jgi:hypothetical protein
MATLFNPNRALHGLHPLQSAPPTLSEYKPSQNLCLGGGFFLDFDHGANKIMIGFLSLMVSMRTNLGPSNEKHVRCALVLVEQSLDDAKCGDVVVLSSAKASMTSWLMGQ